jgi:parallel beta-helix repeat protein
MQRTKQAALFITTSVATLLIASSAMAAEVVVSTEAQLRAAFQNATAGTTITLNSGTYNLTAPLSTQANGTATLPIIVRARYSKQAIVVTNGAAQAFSITHPYWRFQNMFVRVSGAGSYYGFKMETNGAYARVTGNTIELTPGAEAGVKGAGSANGPWPDFVHVGYNEIYFTAPTTYYLAEGIDAVAVNGWWIYNNTIHHIYAGTSGVGYGAFTKGNSSNTVMENNLFYDCFIPMSLGGGGTGSQWMRNGDTTYEDRNGLIRNNVAMNSRDVGLYLYKSNGARVYNNTFYNSYTSCGTGCSSIDVRMTGATGDIRNNIIDKPINNREGGTHTSINNMQLPTPTTSTWFVNAAARNFRLVATAPAINRATALSTVPRDMYARTRRGIGVIPDVGATEY